MDWTQIITILITAIVAAIGAIITKVLIPYLKSKMTAEELQTAQMWVEIAVTAAEQLYKGQSQAGQSKYQYVANFLTSHGIDLTETQLKLLIESAVKVMNDLSDTLEE